MKPSLSTSLSVSRGGTTYSIAAERCPSSCVSADPFRVPVWAHVVTGSGTALLMVIVTAWRIGKWRRS